MVPFNLATVSMFILLLHLHNTSITLHVYSISNIIFVLDIAYVKCNGKWYSCDDTFCKEINDSQVVVSYNYLQFYCIKFNMIL